MNRYISLEAKNDYKDYLEKAAQNNSEYGKYLKRIGFGKNNYFKDVEITCKDLNDMVPSEIPNSVSIKRHFMKYDP